MSIVSIKTPKTHVVITYVTVSYMQPETSCRIFCGSLILESSTVLFYKTEGHRLPSERYVKKHFCRLAFFFVQLSGSISTHLDCFVGKVTPSIY